MAIFNHYAIRDNVLFSLVKVMSRSNFVYTHMPIERCRPEIRSNSIVCFGRNILVYDFFFYSRQSVIVFDYQDVGGHLI